MTLETLQCTKCGAPVSLPQAGNVVTCSHCGTEMTVTSPQNEAAQSHEFARQAEEAPPGLIAEFWDFLIHNKKWWLIPIILVLLLLGLIIVLAGSPLAPFIYPVF